MIKSRIKSIENKNPQRNINSLITGNNSENKKDDPALKMINKPILLKNKIIYNLKHINTNSKNVPEKEKSPKGEEMGLDFIEQMKAMVPPSLSVSPIHSNKYYIYI
jgi:hypothetical protein